jgi:hypothetical protein
MWRGGVETGCPTIPSVEHVWKFSIVIPTSYPAFSGTTVRCEFIQNDTFKTMFDDALMFTIGEG